MASITGSGGDYSENYSRRGNAARGKRTKAQNFLASQLAQVMAALEGCWPRNCRFISRRRS
jgi:hypothetical protein